VAKPLWGIPFAIKDNVDSAGAPTTAACPAYEYLAEQDAFAVAALRRAGAILIGKTNLDQFATGLVGVRSPYPVPLNALDPAIVPGGSSSGSAVAVARGLVSFALGTDTAGSGRVPAALNGIVGLKPTLGALSNAGVVPACRTLDTVSVFALTVDDAYRVYRQAALYDPADPYARPVSAPPLSAAPPRFSVGVPDAASRRFFGDDAQAASFAAGLEDLAALGGEIVEVDFGPFYDVAEMLYEGAWVAERFAVIENLLSERPDAVHPVTRQIIEKARAFSAADAFRGFYRLQELKRRTAPLLASVDLLSVPTIPTFYNVADLAADPFGPNARLGTYTNFVNLLDLCALAVPTAPRRDGRPGSLTLLAAAGQDAVLAALGRAVQARSGARLGATAWQAPRPPRLAAAAQPDEIALAVVGAHMSGLPLNHELTARGARFLRAAKTAPCYRLYSLPGGPPARPGLLRDDNAGSTVELEVWALPAARFGDFLRGIPAPLGIGTLRLEGGEEVKGFLCEAGATRRAEEVTAFGGWRAFLAQQSSPQNPVNTLNQNPMNKESGHV
jgi:allophanate hydrolase